MNGVYSTTATPKADIHLARKIVPFQKDDLQKTALQLLNNKLVLLKNPKSLKTK